MDVASVTERLAELHRKRRWIATVEFASSATEFVAGMRDWGAEDVMIVAGQEGSGEHPDAPTFVTNTPTGSGMDGIRAFQAAIADPSPALMEAVSAFDPAGDALVIVAPHSELQDALGRRVYGARPPAQVALEDKMLADEIWDAAGLARAPAAVVAVDSAATAARRLAGSLGTVWVADNKEGFHGGGNYVRWLGADEDATELAEWFGQRADRVRVMPFLDGIPCSIHGWVTHDGIAVFRPIEMLVLRRTDRTGFFYGGYDSYWDPPWRHRRRMRAVALAVGRHLIERVDYVGPYGVDGVLTAEGFLPTELNPRMTIGHAGPADAAGLPPATTVRAHLAGELDLPAEWLERKLLTAADRRRFGRAVAATAGSLPDDSFDIAFTEDGAELSEKAVRQATISTGAIPSGPAVFVRFDDGRTHPGPSLARRAVAAIDLARRTWDLEIPPLEPAPDLFAGSV